MTYEVNNLVRYIREDNEEDKETGFYPQIGTIGRVVEVEGSSLRVNWFTKIALNGGGYVDKADVEFVPTANGWLYAGMFDDFAKCPYCGQHEHPMAEAREWAFCPYCGQRVLWYRKENG